MQDDARQAWGEVGERFAAWGRRVADRYQEAGAADDDAEADQAERELSTAAKELFDEIANGVKALGVTINDREANAELSGALSALGNAIGASVTEAADALRSKRDPGPQDRPPGS
ncbi:MAG: hypothetical protein U0V56_11960 [Actinomycetota bacterium]